MRTGKARTGLRTRLACHMRWSVYGNLCRHTPEAGAVCGKAARTDLGGGRAMKRTSLPLRAPAASWCDPAGGSPAQVRGSARLVASVAWPLATVVTKRTQRLHGVWD